MRLDKIVNVFKNATRTGKPTDASATENVQFDPKTLGEKNVFLEWEAPSRVNAGAINPKLMRTLIIIGIVISMLLVVMQEFALILIVASLIFVSHVLSKTAPELAKYQVSNHGIKIGTEQYYWHELKDFFFTKNVDLSVMVVDTSFGLPSRFFLTIKEEDREKLKNYLSTHIDYFAEEPKTPVDKFFDNIFNKFNITQ